MSFFSSGSVDTTQVNRAKLSDGTYRIRLTDFADYLGAVKGDRTQLNFAVTAGPMPSGTQGSHIVMHAGFTAAWQANRARGEIAAMLGAFLGIARDLSGLKVTNEVFGKNTRTVNQDSTTGKTVEVSREATELPVYGTEAYLIVRPYMDKKTGKRKFDKNGRPSVVYEFYPLSANLTVTDAGDVEMLEDETPPAPEAEDDVPPPVAPDAMESALADGWKRNGETPWFYKKGEPKQLKEADLRAKYA